MKQLVYKDGKPMRKVKIKALEELYKPIFSINNNWFYFDIIKAEDAIFSRIYGYRGKIIFKYSILFYIKNKRQNK